MNTTLSIEDYRRIINVIGDIALFEEDPLRVHSIVNSINDNQLACKQWLVDQVMGTGYLDEHGIYKGIVIGGWHGLIPHMFREHGIEVVNTDIDPTAIAIAKRMFPTIKHKVMDINEVPVEKHGLVVCTSYEHISQEKIDQMVERCRPGTLLAFQGNDYDEVEDHINCHHSLEDFVDSIPAQTIWCSHQDRDSYTRWMALAIT